MIVDEGQELVLVTGAAGWLGRRLVDVLANGLPDDERFHDPAPNLRIRALVMPGQDGGELLRLSPRVEVATGDLRNADDCRKFVAGGSLLFHTAGVIHPRRVREFYDINVTGTRNLLDAAAAAGVRRAVVVSSNSPCGCNPTPDHRFTEASPYNPYMHYGRSKMRMEQLLSEYHQVGKVETVCIRPPWFYGPFQPPRQTQFFRMIRDGKAPIVGGGNNYRSMAYIDNLCQGLLLAANRPAAAGRTYWIADARAYTMNEIVDTIERLLETEFGIPCRHKRLRLPGFAAQVAQMVDFSLQTLGFYHQKFHVLSEMNKTIACDISRAREELDYRPHVDLEEGMRRSIAWVRASL